MRKLLFSALTAATALVADPARAGYLIFDFYGTQPTIFGNLSNQSGFFAFNPALVASTPTGQSFVYSYSGRLSTATLAGNQIDFVIDDTALVGYRSEVTVQFTAGYLNGSFPLPAPEFRGSAPGENIFDRVVNSSFTTVYNGTRIGGVLTGLDLRYFDETYPFPSVGFSSVAAVPEPSTWALMLLGFEAIGCALRRPRRRQAALSL